MAGWFHQALYKIMDSRKRANSENLYTGSNTQEEDMRRHDLTIVLLSIIAAALVGIAVRPIFAPRTAEAQSTVYPLYIEPGSEMLRKPDGTTQVYGKVMVDMRTGKIWGFPTNAPQSYPSNGLQNKPPTSRPFELGRFALEDIDK
jgi:hypothetical protein